jgi:hypothetical protein
MVDEHPVMLRGVSALKAGAAPVLLERTDEDFIEAILAQLPTDQGRLALAATAMHPPVKGPGGALKLYRPVHRTFHVVLVEVSCDIVGRPRLDPARIESAGLVIRRIASGTTGVGSDAAGKGGEKHGGKHAKSGGAAVGTEAHQAWMQAGGKLRAWAPVSPAMERQDPDPARRPPELTAGHPEIDRRLALLRAASGSEPLEEGASSLFVAPPEVCRAVNATVLYGVVPLGTSEVSEAPSTLPLDDALLQKHLPTYFTSASHAQAVPRAGGTLTAANADAMAPEDYVLMLAQLTYSSRRSAARPRATPCGGAQRDPAAVPGSVVHRSDASGGDELKGGRPAGRALAVGTVDRDAAALAGGDHGANRRPRRRRPQRAHRPVCQRPPERHRDRQRPLRRS